MRLKHLASVCVLLGISFLAGSTLAQVSGVCSNCHTMHNSQNGSAVNVDGPAANLLNTDCVGCHSSTGSETIVTLGGSRIPIVYNMNMPTLPLAGGNFYWIAHNGGDAYGHNVYGISNPDATLDEAPGKRVPSFGCTDCHDSLATADPKNGCKGCHVPHHHADDSATVVGENGGWYRFLGDNPGMTMASGSGSGVIGIEEADWEQSPSSVNHNVYQGTTTVYSYQPGGFGGATYIKENSIGSFCAGCHGLFHHDMNEGQNGDIATPGDVSGAWIRHPSDVVIPNSSEYAAYTTYNPLAPVAKGTLIASAPADYSVVSPGSDVVTCISCHRPHGSPYPDMLRWDYMNECNTGIADVDCGCFVCHSTKDD